MKSSVEKELGFAKGMMDRREHVRANLRNAVTRSQAVGNYKSLLRCLMEVQKHHNNITKAITNDTAGYAHESSLLLDSARKWVDQARIVAMERGATARELSEVDRAVNDTAMVGVQWR